MKNLGQTETSQEMMRAARESCRGGKTSDSRSDDSAQSRFRAGHGGIEVCPRAIAERQRETVREFAATGTSHRKRRTAAQRRQLILRQYGTR
jgi:hypothetical protein